MNNSWAYCFSANMTNKEKGFTLIEISIVLVIIGLVIGSVLVGQDLINAAACRAQISQIEKYNAAVNTFRGKYNNQLPGDMDPQTASMFGFTNRTTTGVSPTTSSCPNANSGLGDNNGVIQGFAGWWCYGAVEQTGETVIFWQDLSSAGLIDGGFNSLSSTGAQVNSSLPITTYFPQAKIGNGNYVYVWSGGWHYVYNADGISDGVNYYGVSVLSFQNWNWGVPFSTEGITVAQAFAIDSKIDDGLPQFGNVLALFVSNWAANVHWASGPNSTGDALNDFDFGGNSTIGNGDSQGNGAPIQNSSQGGTAARPSTCFDTSSGAGIEKYSMSQNSGSGVNCALSFKFQ